MKTLKYILACFILVAANSCLVDNTVNYDQNDDGLNVAGFEDPTASFSFICSGAEYQFPIQIKVVGPTVRDVTGDVVLTIAPDFDAMDALAEADTNVIAAIEGTHFRLDNPTITLKANNNYLGLFNVTTLTAGLEAPLPKIPMLILKTTGTTGESKITNNGKPILITLNYACFSNLGGDYDVHTVITRTISGAVSTYDWSETITETGIGTYRTTVVAYDGYVNPAPAGGTDGFTFTDVCDVLTVPQQNLVDLYSNLVYGNLPGWHDDATGVLHMEYTVTTTAAAGFRSCVSDYTPQ